MKKLRRTVQAAVFWLTWPGLWLMLRWSHRTRLLMVCGEEFLVLRGRLGGGLWGLPGGGLHRHEKPIDGILREVQEEIGVALSAQQLAYAFDDYSTEKGLRFHYHAFVTQVQEKPSVKLQRMEIAALQWQPLKSPVLTLNQDTKTILKWWLSQT